MIGGSAGQYRACRLQRVDDRAIRSIVAVAAAVRVEDGAIAEAKVGLTNMGSTPLRAAAVESALVGRSTGDLGDACSAAADGTNPPSDLNGDAEYRKHLATVLTKRAVLAAAGG